MTYNGDAHAVNAVNETAAYAMGQTENCFFDKAVRLIKFTLDHEIR